MGSKNERKILSKIEYGVYERIWNKCARTPYFILLMLTNPNWNCMDCLSLVSGQSCGKRDPVISDILKNKFKQTLCDLIFGVLNTDDYIDTPTLVFPSNETIRRN